MKAKKNSLSCKLLLPSQVLNSRYWKVLKMITYVIPTHEMTIDRFLPIINNESGNEASRPFHLQLTGVYKSRDGGLDLFYQVKVLDEDSSLFKLLWWKGGDYNEALTKHKMVVHLFGTTSSPVCASFALKHHTGEFKAEVVQTVFQNFYVDDCLKHFATDEAVVLICQDLIELCARGGFRLHKWVRNSRKILQSIL